MNDRSLPMDASPMATDLTGVIFDIKKFAIHDGPGIRTTVFLKGCPMTCHWCHNPEGQRTDPEPVPCPGAAPGPERHSEAVIGRRVDAGDVLAEIEKDRLFYDESGGGATFSGGEPLMQPDFLEALLDGCRSASIHTVLDTTGYAPARLLMRIMDKVDLFHYDLKLVDSRIHQRFTGVPVEPVLDNLQRLSAAGRPIVIRFPLVPGVTDDWDNMKAISARVRSLPTPPVRLDVLPFHHLHAGKYARLGRQDPMGGTDGTSAEAVKSAADFFRADGIPVTIGG
jgi:pyruvate formate lyase activating enzyme